MSHDRNIRVCIAVGGYPPQFAGHGIQTYRSIPYLRAHGITPTVLSSALKSSASPDIEPYGDRVHRLLNRGGGFGPRFKSFLQFRRYFRQRFREYDLLHSSFLQWDFLLNIGFVRSLGLPVVVEMVLLGDDDPLAVSHERFGKFKLHLLREVDAWVGIARAFLPRVRAVGIPEERFHLIRTGVDVEKYRPLSEAERREARQRLNLPPDARIAVSIGSVIPRKGMDRVVRAWVRLDPVQGRDLLLIIGPKSQSEGLSASAVDHVRWIEEFCRHEGASDTVRLLGFADNPEVYLAAADIFIFLSRQEGLGTVTLEAMSCGLPSIVSPLDGIAAEIVDEGKTGFIIERPDDPATVSARVGQLLADHDLRRSMGEAARRLAQSTFSFATRAAALSSLYRDLLSRRRTQGTTAPGGG